MSVETLTFLGAGFSALAALWTLLRLLTRHFGEEKLVDRLRRDETWQQMLSRDLLARLSRAELTQRERERLLFYLRNSSTELNRLERAQVLEGLYQDSARGQMGYLAKLAEESVAT